MQVYIYLVPLLGDGSDENPIRPDIPVGYNWIGKPYSETSFGIATKIKLPLNDKYRRFYFTLAEIEELLSQQEEITIEEFTQWYVEG